jgi:hypothetical protein
MHQSKFLYICNMTHFIEIFLKTNLRKSVRPVLLKIIIFVFDVLMKHLRNNLYNICPKYLILFANPEQMLKA